MLIRCYRNVIFVLRKCFRRKNTSSILLFVVAVLVFINEFGIFYLNKRSWPIIDCAYIRDKYKILLVADPQILGENAESWIARWDSDRFLRRTFLDALQYTQPDAIVFLGDLMDEGNIANTEQFSRYFTRFKWIFNHKPYPVNMTIFLPGDNDIGGENEPIYYSNVERFEKYFGSKSNVERFGNLEIYKVNKLLRRFPDLHNISNSTIRLAVSHIPILGYSDDTSEKVITVLRPQLIFSGHDHKSIHFVGDLKTGETLFMEIADHNVAVKHLSKWRFQTSLVHTNEMIVPTCSYRMGAWKIGFGVAIISANGDFFCYQILWLPQRLYQLISYLCCLIIIVFILIFPSFARFCTSLPTLVKSRYTNIK